MLDTETLGRLQQLWEEGAAADAAQPEAAMRRRNISPQTGRFLYQLVRGCAARRIVEIGTSNGYSALWLALAARTGHGHVTSLDVSADAGAAAAANLASFGLEGTVTLLQHDGGAWLDTLDGGPVDFLFLDADRSRYAGWWPQICRVLRPGGLVVMDNALSHAEECAPFVAAVLATPGYLAETYPIGKGQFVILKDD